MEEARRGRKMEPTTPKNDDRGRYQPLKPGIVTSDSAGLLDKADDEKDYSCNNSLSRNRRGLRTFRITEGSIVMESDIPYVVDGYEQKKDAKGMNCSRCMRGFFKVLRSLLGLVVLLLAYTFLGAWIMMSIEGPNETMQREDMLEQRQKIVDLLRNNTRDLQSGQMNESYWERLADEALLEYEQSVISIGLSTTSKRKWTFFGSVLFCVTTYTTIGYGNIAPSTKAGRIATMLYAAIGIPLALIVLADLGRRLTTGLKYLWSFLRRYYYTGYCRKVYNRRHSSYSMNQLELGEDAIDGKHASASSSRSRLGNGNGKGHEHNAKYRQEAETRRNERNENGDERNGRAEYAGQTEVEGVDSTENHTDGADAGPSNREIVTNGAVDKHRGGEEGVDGIKVRSVKIEPLSRHSEDRDSRRSHTPDSNGTDQRRRRHSRSESLVFGPEPEEDFNLPVAVAIGFIVFYMLFGAFMYTLWEDWTYLESFYFVFITASTIGFGDVLPAHPNFFLLTCVYTFFGLALVSMTINVTMEFLAKTIDRAKEKVGEAKQIAKAKARQAKGRLSEAGCKAKHKVAKTIAKVSEGTPSPEERHQKGYKHKKNSLKRESSEEPENGMTAEESRQNGTTGAPNANVLET